MSNERLSEIPLSTPLWACVGYVAILLGLAIISGSFAGFAAVVMAAAFSFQFWTYAAWRGSNRHQRANTEGDA